MKKQAISALLILLLLLTACMAPTVELTPPGESAAPAEEPAETPAEVITPAPGAVSVALMDMLGRQVRIAGVPETIVSLSPSATETLFALGAESALVGVSGDCTYPDGSEPIPEVMTIEDAIALDPALVFVDGDDGEDAIAALEDAGIAVVCAESKSYRELYGAISLIAQIMAKDPTELMASMQEGVQAVVDEAEMLHPHTAVCVLGVMDDGALLTTGESSFVTELMALASATPLIADSPEQAGTLYEQTLSVEQVLDLNPDVLLVAESCADDAAWGERPLSLLTAVEDGRLYPIADELIAYAGPRVPETARAIYEALEQAQMS